ncbi:NUDIX domain-containing protein [Pelagibacterales bacterium SAG-MED16]|nr:NUDIX domain-containing protein [Pelagibacterales bacterium SAG-MED16]
MVVAEIKKYVFVLVSQKRIPVNKINYEFTSGMIDKGENSISAACREFYEKTGYII